MMGPTTPDWGLGGGVKGVVPVAANAGFVLLLKFSSSSALTLFHQMVTASPGMNDALVTS